MLNIITSIILFICSIVMFINGVLFYKGKIKLSKKTILSLYISISFYTAALAINIF
jgi:hypothetical protein